MNVQEYYVLFKGTICMFKSFIGCSWKLYEYSRVLYAELKFCIWLLVDLSFTFGSVVGHILGTSVGWYYTDGNLGVSIAEHNCTYSKEFLMQYISLVICD